MIVYRMGRLSFALIIRLLKITLFGLPNLLAQKKLVPECVQDDVRAEVLGPLLLEALDNIEQRSNLQQEFLAIHRSLRRNASQAAAHALLHLIGEPSA